MENENLENQSVEEVDEIDAIGALKAEIADLKANTVSKSQYNKLKKAYVEGGSLASKDLKDTVLRLHNKTGNNIQNETDLLHFRDLYMELGGRDPFNPAEGEVSNEDLEMNEKRAQLGRYAIEQSKGDPQSFSAIFGSNLKDVPGIRVKR